MKYWTEYKGHSIEIVGKKEKYDDTIYSFDIETTSYFILENNIYNASKYIDLSEKEKEKSIGGGFMYIWMLSINENVYYGRTWEELELFFKIIDYDKSVRKIIFVHNLSFEFQFLINKFEFEEVLARKSHKVMKCKLKDYNIEFRCTYMMSNCVLKKLPDLYNLPVKKMVGDLDYDKIRISKTPLTEKELKYCENDCLVVYEYIKYEKTNYENLKKIPLTNTGQVRRELKERIYKDYIYKRQVKKAINTDPHIYNLLQEAFMGRLYSRKLDIY